MNVPVTEADPVMVIVFDAQDAVTPVGSPVGVPISVAPVVKCVISVKGVFSQRVGEEDAAPTVLSGETTIDPTADTVPQPPVKGIS